MKPEYRNKILVAIDPGETTGACCFYGGEIFDARQLVTKNLTRGIISIGSYLRHIDRELGFPNLIVCEDYRVYDWKSDAHKWQGLHTPKLIGAIECIGMFDGIPVVLRMAQQAKQFCTDEKLKDWDLWLKGEQHARDAVRHAVFQLVHGDIEVLERPRKKLKKILKVT